MVVNFGDRESPAELVTTLVAGLHLKSPVSPSAQCHLQ